MFRGRRSCQTFLSLIILGTLLMPGAGTLRASDIVPSSDITGGASIFVFRSSSKRPQSKAADPRRFNVGGGTAQANRTRVNSQIAAKRSRRQTQARGRAAELARIRARERNARLRQSNALTARGESQLEAGELDLAINNFREALKLNPNNADANDGLSDALIAKGIEAAGPRGDIAGAEYLLEAVSIAPDSDVAYAKLGEIYDANGRTREAADHYQKALDIDPEISSLYLPIGFAYVALGNSANAEKYLVMAEAAGLGSVESRMARAIISMERGNHDNALIVLDQIVEEDPNNAEAYYRRAVVFDRMNLPDAAFGSYMATVKADPTFAEAWYEIGVAYYNQGDYPAATSAYQQVIKHEPEHYRAHANLAAALRQQMKYAEANAHYRTAEPGFKSDPDHYSEWGYCLGKTDEWDKATARLETAEKLSPSAIDHNNLGWGYYNAARASSEANNSAEAEKQLQLARAALLRATQMDPALYPAFLNLGATNNAIGDFAAAVEALNRALVLQGNWVLALNQLGIAQRGTGDLKGAINQFVRSTSIDGKDVFALYSLGELYHLTGNRREARRIHDRLKPIDPVMANRLNDVLTGKIVLDEANRRLRNRIPSIRRIPY